MSISNWKVRVSYESLFTRFFSIKEDSIKFMVSKESCSKVNVSLFLCGPRYRYLFTFKSPCSSNKGWNEKVFGRSPFTTLYKWRKIILCLNTWWTVRKLGIRPQWTFVFWTRDYGLYGLFVSGSQDRWYWHTVWRSFFFLTAWRPRKGLT